LFSFFRLQTPLIEALWHAKEAAKSRSPATVKLKIGGTSGGANFLLYRLDGGFIVPSIRPKCGVWREGRDKPFGREANKHPAA
jgi:hypothetical protein